MSFWLKKHRPGADINGKFLLNVSTLISGTAVAQIIQLLFVPWITRIYGPEAFGGLGYYSSLLGFLMPLVAFSYPLALVLSKLKIEARLLLDLSLKLALIMSFIVTLIFYAVDKSFEGLIPFSNSYLYIPLGMFLSFLVVVYTQWAIRYERYRLIAFVTIMAAIIGGLSKIILGNFYPNEKTLIIITIVVLLFNVVILSIKLDVGIRLREILVFRDRHLTIAKKYLRFPIFRTPHSLMVIVSQIAPIFLLTYYFGPKYAGYFVLTRAVLFAPITLIGKAVYDVSYPRISQRYNDGEENIRFISKLSIGLAGISMLPLIAIFFWGEEIFTQLFGEEWRRAGLYATWMALWFAFNFCNKAVVAAVSVYAMDGFLFQNGMLNMVLSLTGFFIGAIYFESDIASVALFSLFGVFCQLFLIIIVLHEVKRLDMRRLSILEEHNK